MNKLIYAPMRLIPNSWSHRDKWAHAMMGMIIYVLALLVTTPLIALSLVFVAAIGKEIYDYFGTGNPSVWDIVATVLMPTIIFMILCFRVTF